MSGRGRGVGFGVEVRGLSILTEAKQNGTVHRSGSPLWGKKKIILIDFLMNPIINRWLNQNKTSD